MPGLWIKAIRLARASRLRRSRSPRPRPIAPRIASVNRWVSPCAPLRRRRHRGLQVEQRDPTRPRASFSSAGRPHFPVALLAPSPVPARWGGIKDNASALQPHSRGTRLVTRRPTPFVRSRLRALRGDGHSARGAARSSARCARSVAGRTACRSGPGRGPESSLRRACSAPGGSCERPRSSYRRHGFRLAPGLAQAGKPPRPRAPWRTAPQSSARRRRPRGRQVGVRRCCARGWFCAQAG